MARRLRWLLPLAALLALTVGSYRPALEAGFVDFDDTTYVSGTPQVARGLDPEGMRWALTAMHFANWHPLTWISHMADVELYGQQPAGHHATNLVLHVLNVALLFLVLRSLTGDPWPSFFVAGVLALHPANAESVAWIAQRKTLLSTGFALLCIGSYGRHARGGGWPFYVASVVCLGLSLASKAMLVTMPFLLLLLDYWPLRRPFSRKLLWEKVPFLLLALGTAWLTWLAQQEAISPIDTYAVSQRLANVAYSYVRYLGMFFAPLHLAAFYPLFVEDLTPLRVGGSVAFLLVLSAGVFALARRLPYLAVGWLWFLGSLVPVIGLVQVGMQALADRYVYVPFLGLAIAVAWSVQDLLRSVRGRALPALTAAAAVALLGGWALLTFRQAATWHDEQSLFEHAIANTHRNWKAHAALASVYFSRGELEKAAAQSEEALRYPHIRGVIRSTYGLTLYQKGERDLAREQFERATLEDPDEPIGFLNLGWFLSEHGEYEQALVQLLRAQSKVGARTLPYTRMMIAANQAGTLEKLQRLPQAREKYDAALAIDPDAAAVLRDAARVDLQLGDAERASARLRHALALDPQDADAAYLLASAAWLSGDPGAGSAFDHALAQDPRKVAVAAMLARKLAASGRADEGLGLLRALVERPPVASEEEARAVAASLRLQLAEIALAQGDAAAAMAELGRALAASPDDHDANHRLAWLLATSADPHLRDPTRAIEIAERLTKARREYSSLATLGVAYAAAGRRDEAAQTSREALELARKAQDARAVGMLEQRLAELEGSPGGATGPVP